MSESNGDVWKYINEIYKAWKFISPEEYKVTQNNPKGFIRTLKLYGLETIFEYGDENLEEDKIKIGSFSRADEQKPIIAVIGKGGSGKHTFIKGLTNGYRKSNFGYYKVKSKAREVSLFRLRNDYIIAQCFPLSSFLGEDIIQKNVKTNVKRYFQKKVKHFNKIGGRALSEDKIKKFEDKLKEVFDKYEENDKSNSIEDNEIKIIIENYLYKSIDDIFSEADVNADRLIKKITEFFEKNKNLEDLVKEIKRDIRDYFEESIKKFLEQNKDKFGDEADKFEEEFKKYFNSLSKDDNNEFKRNVYFFFRKRVEDYFQKNCDDPFQINLEDYKKVNIKDYFIKTIKSCFKESIYNFFKEKQNKKKIEEFLNGFLDENIEIFYNEIFKPYEAQIKTIEDYKPKATNPQHNAGRQESIKVRTRRNIINQFLFHKAKFIFVIYNNDKEKGEFERIYSQDYKDYKNKLLFVKNRCKYFINTEQILGNEILYFEEKKLDTQVNFNEIINKNNETLQTICKEFKSKIKEVNPKKERKEPQVANKKSTFEKEFDEFVHDKKRYQDTKNLFISLNYKYLSSTEDCPGEFKELDNKLYFRIENIFNKDDVKVKKTDVRGGTLIKIKLGKEIRKEEKFVYYHFLEGRKPLSIGKEEIKSEKKQWMTFIVFPFIN